MTSVYGTRRWQGITGVALGAASVGVLAATPDLLLVAVLVVGYAAYSRLIGHPAELDVTVDRSISPPDPDPDQPVSVRLRIRNLAGESIPDLRIVDGVPPMASVVNGTPRSGTTLAPGGSVTVEYAVQVPPGKHRFGAVTLVSRNINGSGERISSINTSTVIDCLDTLETAPILDHTTARAGPIPTDRDGAGVEFFGIREHYPGDDLHRIDWARFARTGELSSIVFRTERSANIVVCLDTSTPGDGPSTNAIVSPTCLGTADRLVRSLIRRNHSVGLLHFDSMNCWIPPQAGRSQAATICHALNNHPAFAQANEIPPGHRATYSEPGSIDWADSLATRDRDRGRSTSSGTPGYQQMSAYLEPDDQVVFVTGLLTGNVVESILGVGGRERKVLVLSPDMTSTESSGGRLARLERNGRIRTLRKSGIPVIDWNLSHELEGDVLRWMEPRYA